MAYKEPKNPRKKHIEVAPAPADNRVLPADVQFYLDAIIASRPSSAWTPAFKLIAEKIARNYVLLDRVEQQIVETPSLIVTGGNGQPMPNPLFKMQQELQKTISALCARIGISASPDASRLSTLAREQNLMGYQAETEQLLSGAGNVVPLKSLIA